VTAGISTDPAGTKSALLHQLFSNPLLTNFRARGAELWQARLIC
jgi:hypothetical protein